MLVRHRTYPTIDRSVDRAFEQLANSFFEPRRSTAGPVVDGAWKDGTYVLTVDLPGVPADAVAVEVTGNMLVLGAKVDDHEWQRSLRLGSKLDPDQVSARHVDGRLTVEIGTFAEPEARSIAIDTTPPAAIEAASSDADDDSSAD